MPSLYDAQVEQQRFDAVWRSPADLTSWGFPVQTSFAHVYPGSGYGVSDRGNYEDYFDYGAFSGAWNISSMDAGQIVYPNKLEIIWLYERQYELCGNQLMQTYCSLDESSFITQVNSFTHNALSLPELPVPRTANDYYARIQSCVNAYGGCANVQALLNDWNNRLGSNTWRD
jgi:hypothetical protein